MNTPRRLVQQAKKWQLMAALRNRRLVTMWPIKEASLCGSSAIADKGHCIVYTSGGERFEVPLVYHITMVLGVPCDVAVMAYAMCLLKRKPSEEVGRVTVSSVVMPHGNQSGTAMVCKGLGQSLVIF